MGTYVFVSMATRRNWTYRHHKEARGLERRLPARPRNHRSSSRTPATWLPRRPCPAAAAGSSPAGPRTCPHCMSHGRTSPVWKQRRGRDTGHNQQAGVYTGFGPGTRSQWRFDEVIFLLDSNGGEMGDVWITYVASYI